MKETNYANDNRHNDQQDIVTNVEDKQDRGNLQHEVEKPLTSKADGSTNVAARNEAASQPEKHETAGTNSEVSGPISANLKSAPSLGSPALGAISEDSNVVPPVESPTKKLNSGLDKSNHSGAETSQSEDKSSNQAFSLTSKMSFMMKPSAYLKVKHSTNRNSLELRKLPINILLKPSSSDDDSLGSGMDSNDDGLWKTGDAAAVSLLQKTCLNSTFSLRMQMMLSFGSISFISIVVVVIVSLMASALTGDRVIDITVDTFDGLAQNVAGTIAHYLADDLTPRLLPKDLVQIIHDSTRDRFEGYPIYENDSQVPFQDVFSQTNQYPLKGPPLPLDWQMPLHQTESGTLQAGNVNSSNYYEHVQDRYHWYVDSPSLDTSSAGYYLQGMCDPDELDPMGNRYFPNCTDANNNISTGGVIAPSPTSQQIHRKASDLVPLMKALFEYNQDVAKIGLYFANSGAGATVNFPHIEMNYSATYTSAGCNWMLTDHPLDSTRTFASLEDFERCELDGLHVNGNELSSRLYNPMDRPWCSAQALDPHRIHHFGPIQSAWVQGGSFMTIGRAVYDRITKDFVACISVDFSLDSVQAILQASKVTASSELSIVRFRPDGAVVASTAWDSLSPFMTLKTNESATSKVLTIDELNIGLSNESFRSIYDLVDFQPRSNNPWEPEDLVNLYEETLVYSDGFIVAAYPIPPVPAKYDSTYQPEFLVVVSIAEDEFFLQSNKLRGSVEDTLSTIQRNIIIVGCIGIGMMVLIITMVANTLTAPIKYMNSVAAEIVNSFGENVTVDDGGAAGSGSQNEQAATTAVISVNPSGLNAKCAPKTELGDIQEEFMQMVKNFSGNSMAKNAKDSLDEIENRFSLGSEFQSLYASRQNTSRQCTSQNSKENTDTHLSMTKTQFKYRFPLRETSAAETIETSEGRVKKPSFINFGYNGRRDSMTTTRSSASMPSKKDKNYIDQNELGNKGMASPLFFWIVVLIVTPLLLTTVTISCVVMINIANSYPNYVTEAKGHFVEGELFALETYVSLRANLTSVRTELKLRDHHVMTRYSSWVLFQGVSRTNETMIATVSGVEECKYFEVIEECPYVEETTCECDLISNTRGECYQQVDNTTSDYRYLQRIFFTAESHDADPVSGARHLTSYPDVCFSQPTTAWWDENYTAIPGFSTRASQSFSSEYDTTFARLRSIAAIPIMQSLYNYAPTVSGIFVVMEEDGLFAGFDGCATPGEAGHSSWVSDVANGAYDIRPELCPLGKYGYDPRCRNWYDKGMEANGVDRPFVYVTPPYLYAGSGGENVYAQSASSPLIDAKTGQHIGQALADFSSQDVIDSLGGKNFVLGDKGFPILVTIESDNFGADAVIGPGLKREAKPIEELVLPNDPKCMGSACEEGFHEILAEMKAGKNGTAKFTRVADDGSNEEIYISYAPVAVRSLAIADGSDFGRGVFKTDYLLYSLAFAEYEYAMLNQFESIQSDIDKESIITVAVLCLTIFASACFVVYFSKVITESIADPMIQLLLLMRSINSLQDGEDRPEPPIDRTYGSREVLHVTITMERLYKVIRSANTAFFAGDVETAYEVLNDALKLFRRLSNKKAIGVATNNLGNTMLAAYRTLKATKEKRICGFKKREIIAKGTSYFHEAIQLGEAAYDSFYEKEGWSPNCLDFMQHLSNRYFNRAMFLLTVKKDHSMPEEIQELGMRDLQISRDMDVEINEEGNQVGWNVRTIDKKFDTMLTRFKGHLSLLEMGYEDQFGLEEWLDEAFLIVRNEIKNPSDSDLFIEIKPAGRMQQIELELMKYYEIRGDLETAAKIAIRMLVEDQYILASAMLQSVQILLRYVSEADRDITPGVKEALEEFNRRLHAQVEEVDATRIAQADIDSDSFFEANASLGVYDLGSSSNVGSSEFVSSRSKVALMQSTRGDTTMEIF